VREALLADASPVRIGISSCLLGEQVRFDGGHKRDSFLVGTFGRFVEFVPVCPEVEMGLEVPRDTLRLERRLGQVRLVMPKTGEDHTEAMQAYARRRVHELQTQSLSGYVLKKDSPSCGMERVRLYDENGVPAKTGRGLFAEALLERFPTLPVEEEGRLGDARIRENFIKRVFAFHRLRRFFDARWNVGGLIAFHTAHKLLIMAHSPAAYARIGRLVAEAKRVARDELRLRYTRELMEALQTPTTNRRHTNVLHHILGYFKKLLPEDERGELLRLIDDYHAGLVPLIVPLTLIRHHARLKRVAYLEGQLYLEPHPKELMLLNHV
jgi:uncharacterized protein YbgA (DUF1722 family)/uncharacterized protein YbbK (DUF523 family)